MPRGLNSSAEKPSAESCAWDFLLLQEEWPCGAISQGQPGIGRLSLGSKEPEPRWKAPDAGGARMGQLE